MDLLPIEAVHMSILSKGRGPTNPHFESAANFQEACSEIWKSPLGQDFIRYLAAHAHPCKHIPRTDPIQAAHAAGRAEMVAFIVLTASPDFIPNLAQLSPPPNQTPPNEHRTTRATETRRKK